MKKLIFKIFLWIAIIVALDICFGVVMGYLYMNSKGGETYKQVYITEKSNEDILIFGSSRVSHHYDPKIFQDSLGMSCFNCGYDGNGILLNYCNFNIITNRYLPKYIMYDVAPKFDYLIGDNITYLRRLRPFYTRKNVVKDMICEIDKTEKVKCRSSFYRYNSLSVSLILNNYANNRLKFINGYFPLNGIMLKEPEEYSYDEDPFQCLDSLKIKYLSKLIDECRQKDITLIFCISPYYKRSDFKDYEPLFEIAGRNNIPVLDYSTDSAICTDPSLFSDGTHLNKAGAEKYSRLVVSDIKDLLNSGRHKDFDSID